MCKLEEIESPQEIGVNTPYGKPSAPIIMGKLFGKDVAFLPRHGPKHTIFPHKIPYKANIAALKFLGVQQIIGTCVVGSLKEGIPPGSFVIPNQFINFTWGRDDTSDIDQEIFHLPMASPYCENLRDILFDATRKTVQSAYSDKTIAVIQGPRFSTIAEGKMFSILGGDIVNMTQYPECYFARELGVCYAVIASVTNYDGSVPIPFWMNPESMPQVLKIFKENIKNTKIVLKNVLHYPKEVISCDCAKKRVEEYYKMAGKDTF
jgi:5'-methylthioadenosine phosphorylase